MLVRLPVIIFFPLWTRMKQGEGGIPYCYYNKQNLRIHLEAINGLLLPFWQVQLFKPRTFFLFTYYIVMISVQSLAWQHVNCRFIRMEGVFFKLFILQLLSSLSTPQLSSSWNINLAFSVQEMQVNSLLQTDSSAIKTSNLSTSSIITNL